MGAERAGEKRSLVVEGIRVTARLRLLPASGLGGLRRRSNDGRGRGLRSSGRRLRSSGRRLRSRCGLRSGRGLWSRDVSHLVGRGLSRFGWHLLVLWRHTFPCGGSWNFGRRRGRRGLCGCRWRHGGHGRHARWEWFDVCGKRGWRRWRRGHNDHWSWWRRRGHDQFEKQDGQHEPEQNQRSTQNQIHKSGLGSSSVRGGHGFGYSWPHLFLNHDGMVFSRGRTALSVGGLLLFSDERIVRHQRTIVVRR